MSVTRIGIPFNLKNDWRALFRGDAWFMYQERLNVDGYVLRKLNLINYFKWYFYQFIIWLLMRTLRPLALMADHYWNTTEGYEIKSITNRSLGESIKDIKFFRLQK